MSKHTSTSPQKINESAVSNEAVTAVQALKLPGVFTLLANSLKVLGRNWKVFAGITLIYAVLSLALVQGWHVGGNIGAVRDTLDQTYTSSQLLNAFGTYVYVLGVTGGGAGAATYQLVLFVVMSLAIIYTLRQLYAGHEVYIRDGFYRGMSGLIPFICVLLVIVLELVPLLIGTTLYGIVTTNGLAVNTLENVIWIVVCLGLAITSFYIVPAALLALYAVSLPNMTPMQGLRAVREQVSGRRASVVWRIIFLPIVLAIVGAAISLPFIMFVPAIAAWVFFALSMLVLPVAHSYLYALYRSLI